MPMHHKGDGKSSLDLMELHHKELDRPSLEPLSFGFTYDTPSYQSGLDPMQVHHEGAYKSRLDPMEPHHKEGDRSSLEPFSFGVTSGTKLPIQSVFNLIWLFFWFAKLLWSTLDPLPMRNKRTVYKCNKFPMPLHHEQNDKSSLDTMPMQQKAAYKSSLDPMELHQKELDRSSLEPLSFGFTYDAPGYLSSLDLNPAWNHFHVALVLVLQATNLNPVWIQCKCIIKEPTNPVWIQWNCTTKKVTDPVWKHSHSALLLVLQSTSPL